MRTTLLSTKNTKKHEEIFLVILVNFVDESFYFFRGDAP